MDIKTKFRGLFVRGSLLIGFFVVATLFINLPWFDDPLHPELVSLGTPRGVSMDNNSLPLIYGLSAANGKDSLAVGQAIVSHLRERYKQGEKITLSVAEMDDILGGPGFDEAWRSSFPALNCNSRLSVDCASRLIAEVALADLDQPRLRLLLERYEEILRAPRFEENEEVDGYTPLPSYGLLMQIARVRLAISYRRDSIEQFLIQVEEDINFWRRVLSDGQTLIAKMVALAGFRNDLEYVSALLRLRDLNDDELQSVRSLLRPLTSDEQNIGEAMLAELRISILGDHSWVLMASDYSWLVRMFFQERATLNAYYLTIVMPLMLRASLPAEEFYHQRGNEKLLYSVRVFPPPLYNLGGKLALKQMAAEHSAQDYISRVHDVNGRVSLIRLQVEIKQNVNLSVDAIVKSSAHRNPYTGEPMRHDVSAGTIGFECLTENQNDVCSVAISKVGT